MASEEKELKPSDTTVLNVLKNVVEALERVSELTVQNKAALERMVVHALSSYRNINLVVAGQNGAFRLYLNRNDSPVSIKLIVTRKGLVNLEQLNHELSLSEDSSRQNLKVEVVEAEDGTEQPR